MTRNVGSQTGSSRLQLVGQSAGIEAPKLPRDLRAEAAVLSALLLKGQLYSAIAEIVSEQDFYRQEHRWIWQAISALFEQGSRIDCELVFGWLKDRQKPAPARGWVSYLVSLVDFTPAMENVEDHAKRVADKARLRRVGELGARLSLEVCGDTGPLDAYLDKVQQELCDITDRRRTLASGVPVGKSIQTLFERMIGPEEQSVIRTGFASVDSLTTGFRPGDLWLLAARPGAGKTALALAMGTSVASDGYGVLVFSLEMPAEQLSMRSISMYSGVALAKLRTKQIYETDWPALVETSTFLANIPMWFEDDANVTIFDLRSRARARAAYWAKQNPAVAMKLIVVDYLQLVRATSSKLPREQQVAEVSGGLKLLARELGVTVLACVQMNRDIESRGGEPRLSDLRESGRLEQDADLVMFLCNEENVSSKQAKLYVAKQRNGPRGKILLGWDGATVRFSDVG